MNQQIKLLNRKILREKYDKTLLWVVIYLIVFGLVMIYSASVEGKISKVNNEYYYIIKQGCFFVITAVCSWIGFFFISMKNLQKLTPWLMAGSMVLLMLVLMIGTEINGARRWIRIIPGFFNLQPAEIFKLATILYLARYLCRNLESSIQWKRIWVVGIVQAVGMALILISRDLGSIFIVLIVSLVILFLGGVSRRWLIAITGIGLVGIISTILLVPYRIKRMMIFLHPESDPFGSGFQTIQSYVANANGGMFGVGLGNGMARYRLPELHTDFIASFITEQLGIICLVILCCAYVWIVGRAFSIGNKAKHFKLSYSSLVAKGIGIWIGAQALMHIGINVGTFPTKGLTLPFISYGGSSLWVSVLAMAILLRIDYENSRKTLGFAI